MAVCAYCGAETQLYISGVPTCLKCSGRASQSEKLLLDDIAKATARVDKASQTFMEVMGQIPNGFPPPDGAQNIHNVSRDLSTARKDLMRAHTRLDDFLRTGIVPEDLTRNG
jgi:hypothetical protein